MGMVVSFWAFGQIEKAALARRHTFVVMGLANQWLSSLKDAETGQRGFLVTGDERFLEPYLAVHDGITSHLKELREATLIVEAQKHLDAVAPLTEAKLADLAQIIELRRQQDTAAVLASVGSGQGKSLMDSIRAEMGAFIQIEEAALAQKEAQFQARMRLLFGIIILTSLLMLAVALVFVYLMHRHSQDRLKVLVHLKTQDLLTKQEETSKQLQTANDALQITEEKLAVTLNSIGDAVLATDAEGRVTYLNSVAEELTGWTLAQAAGKRVDEIFQIVNKDTRLAAVIPVQESLEHGRIVGLANHTVLIARNGTECDIADSCAPIRDRAAKVIGAVLVFRDVTAEYAAHKVLRDSEARLRTSEAKLGGLIASVMDAVIAIDSNHCITLFNASAEEMFGYTAGEMLGSNLDRLIPSPFRSAHGDQVRQFGETNVHKRMMSKPGEVSALHADGSEFPVDASIAQFDVEGQKMFTVVLRNITERKHMDRALRDKAIELEQAMAVAEKSNRAKSDFLSSMSHELRSPLNAILGFAQLMESDVPPLSDTQKSSIDQILHAGWFLLELINDILDLAVVESGRLSLSLEAVSLPEVMIECKAMIEPQAQKRAIRMTFPTFDAPCFIRADRTRLKQVLINLLSNAIKYNKEGGMVEVTCVLTAASRLRISVRDTGAGLSPEMLAQLFQAFNRLGKESTGEEGTGIGLVVSKRLVELMEGTIGAQSRVGVGSVFTIEMSADLDPHAGYIKAASTMAATSPAAVGARSRLVLYVEDNPANLKLVEQLIARRPDLRLLTATDGNEGVNLARGSLPDVILMDINLPGISGIEAMKIIRSEAATANIPVVALSANAIPSDITKGLEAGFFRYLTKPIKVPEFLETLDQALDAAAGDSPLR